VEKSFIFLIFSVSVKATNNEKEAFLQEIQVMKNIGYHKHVVSLIGCCISSDPVLLIEEYCLMGDLRKYLLGIRTRAMEKLVSNSMIRRTFFVGAHLQNFK
jgi:serine/threonine protein kinase